MRKILIAILFFLCTTPAFAYNIVSPAASGNTSVNAFGDRLNAYVVTTTASGNLGTTTFRLTESVGATNNAIIQLRTDSGGGSPSATVVDSVTIASALLGLTCANFNVSFSGAALTASTQYWVVYTDSTGGTGSQLFSCATAGTAGGANSKRSFDNGATWIADGSDYPYYSISVTTPTPAAPPVGTGGIGIVLTSTTSAPTYDISQTIFNGIVLFLGVAMLFAFYFAL